MPHGKNIHAPTVFKKFEKVKIICIYRAEDEKEVAPVQPTPTKKKKKKKNKRQQNNEDDDADEDDMYALPDAGNNLPDE